MDVSKDLAECAGLIAVVGAGEKLVQKFTGLVTQLNTAVAGLPA